MKGIQIGLLAVLAIAIGFAAISNYINTKRQTVQTISPTKEQSQPTKELQNMDVQEIVMVARQFEFAPSTIRAKVGQPVRLLITGKDVSHGITIPEFNVSQRLEPGQSAVVEFTPTKAGTFAFFCNVKCGEGHKDMKGTLVVE